MGYFNNIIADSRGSGRTPALTTVATADLPGIQPLSWPVDNLRSLPKDDPLVPPIAETRTPNLPAVPASARPATVISARPAAPAGAAAPVTTAISQAAPEASRTQAPDETGTHNPTTAAQTPANQPLPLPHQASIPAASLPALQRQISAPDIAGATPPRSHTSSPADRQVIIGSAPVRQRPPRGGTPTMGDTVRSGQEVQARGAQAVPPPSSAMSGGLTSKVVEGERATGTTSTTPVPSIPPPSVQTPQNESQRAVPRTPQVRIGQVNVIVEAPAAPRPQPQVTQAGPLSSRLFLRSL